MVARRAPTAVVSLLLVGSCGTPPAPTEPTPVASSSAPVVLKEAEFVLPGGRIAARSVALARGSTCVLLADASVWCFGKAYQKGRGSTVVREMPLPPAKKIASVDERTYALTKDGQVFEWGRDPRIGEIPAPKLLDVSGVKDLAVGVDWLCLRSDDGAECRDAKTKELRPLPKDTIGIASRPGDLCVATPGLVTCDGPVRRIEHRIPDVVELAASDAWMCARSKAGHVTCWQGDDPAERDVLGDRAFVALESNSRAVCALPVRGPPACVRHTPEDPVATGYAAFDDAMRAHRGVTSVSQGSTGACFVEAGVVWCWGDADEVGRAAEPREIDLGDLSSLRSARDVALGADHTCVLGTDDVVRCWGRNGDGSLGVGDALPRLGPERWRGVPPVERIVARRYRTCAVTKPSSRPPSRPPPAGRGEEPPSRPPPAGRGEEPPSRPPPARGEEEEGGRVFCAGTFRTSAEGGCTPTSACDASPVLVTTGVKDVALGPGFGCVLDVDGGVRCWGSNTFGQLGTGDRTDGATPRPVIDATGAPLTRARKVIAGTLHACAIVDPTPPADPSPADPSKAGGALVCWGYDDPGTQGRAPDPSLAKEGEGAIRVVATPVPMPAGVTDASASCAVLDGGEARCWGARERTTERGAAETGYAVLPARVGVCDATAARGACVLRPAGVACGPDDLGAQPYAGPRVVAWALEGPTSCTVDATHRAACRERASDVPSFGGGGPPFVELAPSTACAADPPDGARPPIVLWHRAVVRAPSGRERNLHASEVDTLAEVMRGPPIDCGDDPPGTTLYFEFDSATGDAPIELQHFGGACDALRDGRDPAGTFRRLTPAGRALSRSVLSELGTAPPPR